LHGVGGPEKNESMGTRRAFATWSIQSSPGKEENPIERRPYIESTLQVKKPTTSAPFWTEIQSITTRPVGGSNLDPSGRGTPPRWLLVKERGSVQPDPKILQRLNGQKLSKVRYKRTSMSCVAPRRAPIRSRIKASKCCRMSDCKQIILARGKRKGRVASLPTWDQNLSKAPFCTKEIQKRPGLKSAAGKGGNNARGSLSQPSQERAAI